MFFKLTQQRSQVGTPIQMKKSLLLAVALASPLALRAQTFPTDDQIIKRIWAIGMDSSQTMHLAQVLFDSIGPRLTGTPDQRRGND